MAAASLTVGTVQVTAVRDVTADFPRALRHRDPRGQHPPLAGPPLTRRPRP
jgi:hypothetical protein